jgi:lipopolysaccharide export LptBFGC system permease protein LptF
MAVAWKETLKRALWLLVAPVLVLLALVYFRLAERRGALVTLLFPFGVVLFLIFITSKTDIDRGP